MYRAYASFDKTKKGSMQQRELADLRSAFLVSEETTPADNLGNLRGHHLVPGFVPRSDVLDYVPRKDRQIFGIMLCRPACARASRPCFS